MNKGTTHATMGQELLYGMNFDSDYYSMYEEVWKEENIYNMLMKEIL